MRKWLKLFLVISTFALISIGLFFILKWLNIANISTLRTLISKSGNWGKLVFILSLSTILTIFCFIPLLNTAVVILGIAMFGAKTAFICCIISVLISNSLLFFLGDKLGEKFACKLIGKQALSDTQDLIHNKSKLLIPILFVTPIIPDEAICLVAGMTKIKYWYLILISLVYHTIEIGLFCFLGSSLIPWSSFGAFEWIVIINLIIVDVFLISKLLKILENKVKNHKNTSKN